MKVSSGLVMLILVILSLLGVAHAESNPGAALLGDVVPDAGAWLNEFESRMNTVGITNGVITLAGALIGAVVTYRIVRGLIEQSNSKIAMALIYGIIAVTALGFSKPDAGWQQTVRHTWANLLVRSQAGVGPELTARMGEAMDNFSLVVTVIPLAAFAKVGTVIKAGREVAGAEKLSTRGRLGQYALKGVKSASGGVLTVLNRAMGALAAGSTLVNGYAYMIYYSGICLALVALGIPLSCAFIAAGNYKVTASLFMVMLGCLVLGAIAPIIFSEVVSIAYIRPMQAAIKTIQDVMAMAQQNATPEPGGFLDNLNVLKALDGVMDAIMAVGSALLVTLALIIGGVWVGIQIMTSLPGAVFKTIKG